MNTYYKSFYRVLKVTPGMKFSFKEFYNKFIVDIFFTIKEAGIKAPNLTIDCFDDI